MTQPINTFQDILNALEQNPELRQQLRQHILTEDLLNLPAVVGLLEPGEEPVTSQLRSHTAMLTEHGRQLAENGSRLARIEGQLAENGSRLATMQGQIRDLQGPRYEARVQELGGRLLRNQGGMERAELVTSQLRGGHGPLHDAAATAAEEGRITEDQRDGLQVADFIYRAVRNGESIYVLAEASIRLHADDVAKARSRADTLVQLTGVNTQPVVFAESATDQALQELARDGGVTWLALASGQAPEAAQEAGQPPEE